MACRNDISHSALLSLIGQQLTYHSQRCEIIDLLDECQLVLEVLENQQDIQATQYGDGHRTVPVTITLPMFDSDDEWHPAILAAGLDKLILSE